MKNAIYVRSINGVEIILSQILFQSFVNMADREAHDIEVGTFYARDAHIANPLLHTICTCLI